VGYEPPIGSFGLPVMNCKKSRRCCGVNSLMVWSRLRTLGLSRLKPWSALMESMRAVIVLVGAFKNVRVVGTYSQATSLRQYGQTTSPAHRA
jgi:hypothetical protein